MRTTKLISTLLAAAACVSASSHSHPVLAFTSKQASSLKLPLPTESSVQGFFDSLFAADKKSLFSAGTKSPACELDAIAIVQVDNLDRNTFASLRHSSTNSLRARSLDAPSQVTFNAAPMRNDYRAESTVTKACKLPKYQVTEISAWHKVNRTPDMLFTYVNVGDVHKEESSLLEFLEALDETHPRNLVVISHNGHFHRYTKRQVLAPSPSSISGNWTEPVGGVFAKYQLFSTPLLLTLILVGGVLIPIVYFAVAQLAQVQTPDQMGVRKDPISGDKKQQ